MENIYTTKLVKIGTSKGVIIPANILDGLGWQRGDNLIFTFAADNCLVIKQLKYATIRGLKNIEGQIDGFEYTIN